MNLYSTIAKNDLSYFIQQLNRKDYHDHYNQLLLDAISCDSCDIAEYLLQNGANIDARYRDGWRPLHFAIHYDYIKTAILLIKYGANVNRTDFNGWTPLHVAAKNGYIQITKILLQHNASFTILTYDDKSIFDIAKKHGHFKFINEIYLICEIWNCWFLSDE